jgi:hypothetical protein
MIQNVMIMNGAGVVIFEKIWVEFEGSSKVTEKVRSSQTLI